MNYRVQQQGEAVVFVQGTAVHSDSRQLQIDALKESYACLSFTDRGMAKGQPLSMLLELREISFYKGIY